MSQTPKILIPGTVLLDQYAATNEAFLGGAEFNFAFHLHHFGQDLDFVARIGADEAGRRILEQLRQSGFPTRHIQTDPDKPSKVVTVTLDAMKQPTFSIPDDVASEYLVRPEIPDNMLRTYALVYFGTTLQHGLKSRATVRTLLAKCRGTAFCDINLRPGKHTPEVIGYALKTSQVLKLNHEELETLSRLFGLRGSFEALLEGLDRDFNIPVLCLTRGAKGAMLRIHGRFYTAPAGNGPVLDTVGAGDAFSACLAMGLLHRWEPQVILEQACAFAGAICGIKGAVPSDPDFYLPWRERFFPAMSSGD